MMFQTLHELSKKSTEKLELKGIFKEAMDAHEEELNGKQKTEVLDLLRKIERKRQSRRQQIRSYRKQVESWVTDLDKLDRAFLYAQEVGNFLPVLQHLCLYDNGFECEPSDKVIPDDWSPTSAGEGKGE